MKGLEETLVAAGRAARLAPGAIGDGRGPEADRDER